LKCCELTAASLREPLTFQRKISTPDSIGGQTVQWIDLYTTRGQVTPLSGREALQAMQLTASITHRVYVRYRADLTAADRVVMRGNPMQIRAVLNMEMRNQWLELMCDAGVAT
jgi:SPP1 family predicted phage head-tail adaptor